MKNEQQSAAPSPDEIRGAAKPVCPTCRHRENSVCSNSWHLSAAPESISAAFMAAPFAKMFNEAFERLAYESAPAQDIELLERIFADILGNFVLRKPSAAPESQQQGCCAARKALEEIRFHVKADPQMERTHYSVNRTGAAEIARLVDESLAAPSECDQLRAQLAAKDALLAEFHRAAEVLAKLRKGYRES
jgi:hypothetical protein